MKPQHHKDGDPPLVCSNCGHTNKKSARFCAACGWLLETRPKDYAPSSFESGRLLVLDALQRRRVEEACRFLDRQIQIGTQVLDEQLQIGTRKLADPAFRQKALGQIGGLLSQIQPKLAGLLTPTSPATRPSNESSAEEAPLFCLRCGVENRPQGRFCLHCGASLTDTTARTDLKIVVDLASDTGRLREINEDRVQVWSDNVEGHPAWLCALADGMGGENAGEVASGMVLAVVGERWQTVVAEQALSGKEKTLLAEAVQEANRRVHAAAKTTPGQQGMGTTVTLLLAWRGMAYLANVGDSRAYLINRSGQINQITQDHSLVAVLVAIGQITPEEAVHHDQRNLLYRSVGREPTVEVDTFVRRLEPGDHLLLCSDGLTLHLRDKEIAEMVSHGDTPTQVCQKLIATANEQGGEDNISIVLLAVEKSRALLGDQGSTEG